MLTETDMKPLDPLSLPLNQSVLIEASAGTGKTYTMVNLYLRLLLGVGCRPLMVEQILVVTFTKAATQELRDRIREKLAKVATLFSQYHSGKSQELAEDPFLFGLYQQIKPNLSEALLRLRMAEKEIDLAAIFTIDSFCQKMLFQFAFDSGVRFDIDLQPDESELLTRLSEETWRELFYPMNLEQTRIVAEQLHSPQGALESVKTYLYGPQPLLTEAQQWLTRNPDDFFHGLSTLVADAKSHWRAHGNEMIALIQAELNKIYKSGVKKSLSRKAYQQRWLNGWIEELNQWANHSQHILPSSSFSRFSQAFLNDKAEEGAQPLEHDYFAKNQSFLTAYQQQFEGKAKPLLLFRFLTHLREKLSHYKMTHREKSFGDMLSFLHQALYGSQGEKLAEQIRNLFPFAMIDEFQDTNQEQYEIFSRIFMEGKPAEQGFIMIGDPKQSIYKFRGADIFTYLAAANHVNEKATLNRNWRSLPQVVECTNRLFSFPNEAKISPFLYEGIAFQAVSAGENGETLFGAAHNRFFLQAEFDEKQAAKQCAYQIQQQLKQAEQGAFFLQKNGENRPLAAQDITVLVRSHTQANLIRNALLECGIQSVFFSERNSVYQTQEAQDLQFVLRACLYPYHQRSLLAALGSYLWGFTAEQIFQLKQDENEWDKWVDCFVHYQQVWQQQGILPMLHQIFVQQGIIQRVNGGPYAERRITDLLHLAELLQNAMPNLENESALLRWYEQQLNNPNGQSDEQKQRLESEAGLVKVVTIHGSKGLEYPIVWLPFAGKASNATKSRAMVIYHRDQGENSEALWDFGSQSDEIKMWIDKAEFSEDLRLLYVALTRAKYQLNIVLPTEFKKGWAAFHYLLSNGEIGLSSKTDGVTAELLKQKGIFAEVTVLSDEIDTDNWHPSLKPQPQVRASIFNGTIRNDGQITSFTSLQAQNERLQNSQPNAPLVSFGDEAQDYDRINENLPLSEAEDEPNPYSPYQFPHSTKVGNLLHKLFEQWDFAQPLSFERVQNLCDQLDLDEEWLLPVQQWLEHAVNTRFGETPFALKDLQTCRRLNEWQFYLRLSNPKALPQLNGLLKKQSKLAKRIPDLQLNQLEGFVRGFVDCIAQVGDKYYVLDYKSNFLGYLPQDYALDNLIKTMVQYRYDFQYLLYTLAVHRYLKSRLGESYCYERDFGGVAYLFLRGMNGTDHSGVFFDKPNVELIEEMDRLFG